MELMHQMQSSKNTVVPPIFLLTGSLFLKSTCEPCHDGRWNTRGQR